MPIAHVPRTQSVAEYWRFMFKAERSNLEVKSIPNPRKEMEDHDCNRTQSGLIELGFKPHFMTDVECYSDDIINGGDSNDTIDGGAGADLTITYSGGGTSATVDVGGGDEIIFNNLTSLLDAGDFSF